MVPTLRPFVDMVRAALASISRLPLELVHCWRFRVAFWLLQALFSEVSGVLVRVFQVAASWSPEGNRCVALGFCLRAVRRLCEGGGDVVGRRHPPCWRSSTGFPWRSGCRAQSTARSAGGGRKRRRQERTGGSRRGEATQGGALMDDYGDVYDKTQILSLMRCETTSTSARYVRAQCIMCTTQAFVQMSSLVYLLYFVSCM